VAAIPNTGAPLDARRLPAGIAVLYKNSVRIYPSPAPQAP
jgi:hypothetical protein